MDQPSSSLPPAVDTGSMRSFRYSAKHSSKEVDSPLPGRIQPFSLSVHDDSSLNKTGSKGGSGRGRTHGSMKTSTTKPPRRPLATQPLWTTPLLENPVAAYPSDPSLLSTEEAMRNNPLTAKFFDPEPIKSVKPQPEPALMTFSSSSENNAVPIPDKPEDVSDVALTRRDSKKPVTHAEPIPDESEETDSLAPTHQNPERTGPKIIEPSNSSLDYKQALSSADSFWEWRRKKRQP